MENYKNFLIDFVSIQIKKLTELEDEISNCNEQDKDYIKGQIMGYYDVLSTMKSQSDLFNIFIPPLEDGLDLELPDCSPCLPHAGASIPP